MSFVSNILEAATNVDLNQSLSDIRTDIEILRKHILEHVDDVFVKYKHRNTLNGMHVTELLRCQQALDELEGRIELSLNTKLQSAVNRNLPKNVQEKLKIVECTLQGLLSIRSILTLIDDLKNQLEHAQYDGCDQAIQSLKNIFKDVPTDESIRKAVETLQMVVADRESTLHQKLGQKFADNIDIICDDAKYTTTIKIRKQNEEMENIVSALCSCVEREAFLHQLANDLWKYIFVPIINKSVILTENEDAAYNLLTVREESRNKANYSTVFNNLEQVVNFLAANLPYTISETTTVLQYIGADFNSQLSDLIVKNCLKDTILSDVQELQNYKIVIDATDKLQKTLLESQIFTSATPSILEYVGQEKNICIDKMCRKYTTQAKEIMKKSLLDLVEVGVAHNPQDPLGSNLEFPQCSVSRHVEELLIFCDQLLKPPAVESPKCDSDAKRFIAVCNIMSTYCVFVPEFHKPYLSSDNAMPQAAAVFMNNCLYIACKSATWDKLYAKHLKPLDFFNFLAEAINMSTTGRHIFIQYVLKQLKETDETMKEAKLDGTVIMKLQPNTKKCIRQCLKQLEKLERVWRKILSFDKYNKTIGSFVNVLCKHLVSDTSKFKNIENGVREELLDVINLILNGAPKLFITPDQMALYVPLWDKLNEFVFELNSVQIS
ncbi:centromere/kinetochore protein zw10 [Dendroctonus ponderosae]|uniref:centromere/kinetochore protein zw10 n=1 Tax=Dendroctonus ponderosae TaxID=77166 RepID=UPI0020362AA3|nr:centromere/kinetochore protein zw10 [Dendroctonus ponderosae]